MENRIIQAADISGNLSSLGNKTVNLKKCLAWGFPVPAFIAIPSIFSQDLFEHASTRRSIVQEIITSLPCERYAVRSSALCEDGKTQSFAGQFMTLVDIDKDGLEDSLFKVLTQAHGRLNGDLEKFSVIVQEYMASDVFGVTFTRDPKGERNMVVEYGFCAGEKIVSGQTKPEKISFFWNTKGVRIPDFFTDDLLSQFKRLETLNKFPQDIEWCINKDKFYLLQTRDVTTISKSQYESILFLEQWLSGTQKYFFEKTGISEMVPQPCKFTADLFSRIYANDGPISNVYKRFGIRYEDTGFLKIIGNELYVDKERELQSLLPAYTYRSDLKPVLRINNFLSILRTIRNIFNLNRIRTDRYLLLFQRIKDLIESGKGPCPYQESLDLFFKQYETIFEINLLAGFVEKKLAIFLRGEKITMTEIMGESRLFIDLEKYKIRIPEGLKGNSIDVQDESVFFETAVHRGSAQTGVEKWWLSLIPIKKRMLQSKIEEAIFYGYLREAGRKLAILNICRIRESLLVHAVRQSFKDPKNIYFTSLEKLSNEDECMAHKQEYLSFNSYTFPDRISSSISGEVPEIIGVSSGSAVGVLQTAGMLCSRGSPDFKNGVILYTETLSPDLTRYFDLITGIVSKNGGLLSHLAIIAREQGLPVIIGVSLKDSAFHLGEKVRIDGAAGSIVKMDQCDNDII